MVKIENTENYSKQRGSGEGSMSLMSQKGECGTHLAQRNKKLDVRLLAKGLVKSQLQLEEQ